MTWGETDMKNVKDTQKTPNESRCFALASNDLLYRRLRPILRYHGGKFLLARWIIEHFPQHRVYTETFGGAASVLLQKQRAYSEIYNDLYGDVVNLFRVLRDENKANKLFRQLQLTPYARTEFQQAYEPTTDETEQARKLILRSFMGFGTKTAKNSEANGFRGGAKCLRQSVADEGSKFPDNVRCVAQRFSGVVIEQRPATQVLKQYDTPETLHYVDPPYPKQSRGDAGDDYAFEMTDDEHRELAETLRSLKGMVVLSGYDCELYKELFADWQRTTKETLADGARKRVEVLWLNESAQKRLSFANLQPSMFRETV